MSKDTYEAAEEAFGVHGPHIDIHNLDPTHKKILLICHDTPDAINDRALLLALFYQPDWNDHQSLYQNFKRLTRPETVSRRFRDLRGWGYIKESKAIEESNYKAYKDERDRHSPIPPKMKSIVASSYTEATPYEQTSLIRNTE